MSGRRRFASKLTEPETSTSGGTRKVDIRERPAEPECVEEKFQIQTAARLKIRAVALPIPIGAAGKTAQLVTPFALCDVQMLVLPLRRDGEVPHFVVAPLQSIAAQRRLDARILDLATSPVNFTWSEGGAPGNLNFSSSFTTRRTIATRLRHSSSEIAGDGL